MNKKGFTLVELLAILVLLSIIALITIVSVKNILSDSKNSLSETQVKNIEEAAKAYYLKEGSLYSNECVNVSKLIEKGYIESKDVKDPKNNKSMTGSVDIIYGSNNYIYEYKSNACEVCKLTDLDGNGSASVSDIVTCGTERFHVMYNTGNEITMLSMYNLNVGDNAYKSGIKGIQNENALGYHASKPKYANVPFATTNYWESSVSSYPTDVYNSNSSIYGYVGEYETYLTSQLKVISAKATLITYQQLLDLGCSGTTCSSAPSWVSTTSYWTATASDASNIWRVSTSKDVVGRAINYSGIGVRPVVTISTDELK